MENWAFSFRNVWNICPERDFLAHSPYLSPSSRLQFKKSASFPIRSEKGKICEKHFPIKIRNQSFDLISFESELQSRSSFSYSRYFSQLLFYPFRIVLLWMGLWLWMRLCDARTKDILRYGNDDIPLFHFQNSLGENSLEYPSQKGYFSFSIFHVSLLPRWIEIFIFRFLVSLFLFSYFHFYSIFLHRWFFNYIK